MIIPLYNDYSIICNYYFKSKKSTKKILNLNIQDFLELAIGIEPTTC